MSQELFAVFKQGVHRRECGGIFLTQQEAEDATKSLIGGECDDYHTFEVIRFVAGEVTPRIPNVRVKYDPDLAEPPAIVEFGRVGATVVRREC